MIDRNGASSIRRQCALLRISRSAAYYRTRGESAENLALIRRRGLETIYRKPQTGLPDTDHHVYPYLFKGLTIDRPD